MRALISLLLLEERGSDFSLDENILKKTMTSVLSECHQLGQIVLRLCKIGESSKQYDAQDYLKHLHSIWETDRTLANLERSNRSDIENDFQKLYFTHFKEGIEQHDYSKLGKLLFMDKNIMGAVIWLLSDLVNEGFSMRRMTDFEQQNARSLICRLAQKAIGQHTELQKRIHEIRDQRFSFSGMINDELFQIAQTISENYKGFLERLLGIAAEDSSDCCLERLDSIRMDFETELEKSNRRVNHRREICQDLEELEFLDLCERQAQQVVSETLALTVDALRDSKTLIRR